MNGFNKIGYTISHEVDFSSRTSAGVYEHRYLRTIPTAIAVVALCYFGVSLAGTLAMATAAGALA